MPCTSPLYAWDTGRFTDNGKPLYFVTRHPGAPSIVEVNKRLSLDPPFRVADCGSTYVSQDGHLVYYLEVPCGHCESCRLAHVKMWSERCMLEASDHDENWFLTLTFRPDVCPKEATTRDLQLFMKRLRKRFGEGIRFFACGEYTRAGAPHYHLILFNLHLDDAELWDANKGYYTSESIKDLWPYGFHILADVTPETCAYVARYTMKKAGDKKGFIVMSRRPGIGVRWLDEHSDQILRTWKVYFPFSDKRFETAPPRIFKKQCDKVGLAYEHHVELSKKVAENKSLQDRIYHKDESKEAQRDRLRDSSKAKAGRLRERKRL